ncbi:MAG: DUF1569 domain-containing protein [Phycisphaeraceae bacterium]
MAPNPALTDQRRQLHFASLDEVLADAEQLAAQPHRTLGQWSLGQIFAHLAIFMQQSLDGFDFQMPAVVRLAARPFRKRFLTRPWPSGIRFPRRAAATLAPPAVSVEEGLQRLRAMIDRLKREPQRHPSPLFGEMSAAEWNQFHCRHAALHLSFVVPGESSAG